MIDITDQIPSDLRILMGTTSQVRWLSPVESGASRARPTGATLFAALPVQWRYGTPVLVGALDATGAISLDFIGGIGEEDLTVASATTTVTSADTPPAPAPYVPSPGTRRGNGAFLSASEQAVYFVGGRRDGARDALGDFWRLDLRSRKWSRILNDARPRPKDVLATAYDAIKKRLFVLDEFKGLFNTRWARLSSYDTRTGIGRTLFMLPRTGFYVRLSLTARDDGKVLLSGVTADGRVHVYRLDQRNGRVSWSGFTELNGALTEDPINTPSGVFYAILNQGMQRMQLVSDPDFSRHRICDKL